jgi:hypothetical protein
MYLKFLGISTFLILIALAASVAFFLFNEDFKEIPQVLIAFVASLLIFFALHYITLTSFGFRDSHGVVSYIPPVLQRIPLVVLLALISIPSIDYLRHYRRHLEKQPLSYDERVKIMNSEQLSLFDKLQQMRMELKQPGVYDQMSITFSEHTFSNRVTSGDDLNKYYNQFSLNKNVVNQLSTRYISSNNSEADLALANGQTKRLNKSEDSILGYLQSRDVFIVMSSDDIYRAKFESISRANGDRLDGVPLIANNSNTLFADLRYRYRAKNSDFEIAIWQRNSSRIYSLRQFQTIPLAMYHNTTTTTFVRDVHWRGDSLFFDLVALDQNNLKEISFRIY